MTRKSLEDLLSSAGNTVEMLRNSLDRDGGRAMLERSRRVGAGGAAGAAAGSGAARRWNPG
jgi:hypothetical protein